MWKHLLMVLVVAGAVLLTTVGPTAPAASAHGSCALDGGYGLYQTPWGGPFVITGIGQFGCGDKQHRRSKGNILLQIYKNGAWRLIADSGEVTDCCNKHRYEIWARDYCEPGFGEYSWRIRVKFWFLYNADGDIAHSRAGKTAGQWRMNCIG